MKIGRCPQYWHEQKFISQLSDIWVERQHSGLQMMLDVFLQVKTTNKLSSEGRTKTRLPTKQKRWGNIALWFDPADLMQPISKPLKSHRLKSVWHLMPRHIAIFFILHAKFMLDVLSFKVIFCGALLKCVFSANCAVIWLVVGVYGERQRERERGLGWEGINLAVSGCDTGASVCRCCVMSSLYRICYHGHQNWLADMYMFYNVAQ